MIGIRAGKSELASVREFFELFKTPWEAADPSKKYRVVLSSRGWQGQPQAEAVLVFGSAARPGDDQAGWRAASSPAKAISWGNERLPIYGDLATFEPDQRAVPFLWAEEAACGCTRMVADTRIVRVGYDLFGEVEKLLSAGQPAEEALHPTLELHVDLVRSLILNAGVPLLEIPPAPHGRDFICCLTHDVDFYGIRRHGIDATMGGFLYRATVGSALSALRGRRSWAHAIANFKAVANLPWVHLNRAPDPWDPFRDYLEVEKNRPATFFLVPFKDRPGTSPSGKVEKRRATKYDVSDIPEKAVGAANGNWELAVHGLDAWRDADAGISEKSRVSTLAGHGDLGVRMHWLYFDSGSPARLERAGYRYDSTVGYNDAVGFRAGCGQVYRLPGTGNLLELPLHIQDTALFYPDRMGLSDDQAFALCRSVVGNFRRRGGALTLNWHGRSLAPERLWRDFYQRLLAEIESHRVWFAKAADAVAWFRQRRNISFAVEGANRVSDEVSVKFAGASAMLPPATIRRYRPAPADGDFGRSEGWTFEDQPCDGRESAVAAR